jgi:hypothetical protein
VHQNAIFVETVNKENKKTDLFTEFTINPYSKFHSLSNKPNSKSMLGAEDEAYHRVRDRYLKTPQEKFPFPQTEGQEVGWDNAPLVNHLRDDPRINHQRVICPMTKFMETAWRIKEAENRG